MPQKKPALAGFLISRIAKLLGHGFFSGITSGLDGIASSSGSGITSGLHGIASGGSCVTSSGTCRSGGITSSGGGLAGSSGSLVSSRSSLFSGGRSSLLGRGGSGLLDNRSRLLFLAASGHGEGDQGSNEEGLVHFEILLR